MKKGAGNANVAFNQAHSQLFVFSTQMANKAADAVVSGTYGSILQYHLEDLDTKNFLRVTTMHLSTVVFTASCLLSIY